MIVDLTVPADPRLVHADNFTIFHCVASRSATFATLASGFTIDGMHLWVPVEWLEALGGDYDAQWRDNLGAMLRYADVKGWVDHHRKAVRAHVEWADA